MIQFKTLKYIKYEMIQTIDNKEYKLTKEEGAPFYELSAFSVDFINDQIRSNEIVNILAFKGVLK
jgi:hypothetical protein